MGRSRRTTSTLHRSIRQSSRPLGVIFYLNKFICWLWRIKPCAPLFLFLIGCNPTIEPSPAALSLSQSYIVSKSCDRDFKDYVGYGELPADDCVMLVEGEYVCSGCYVIYDTYTDDLY